MKICIFHNLPSGGARSYLNNISRCLKGDNHQVDLFTFQKITEGEKVLFSEISYIELRHTSNIFSHIFQTMFELNNKSKLFANIIKNNNYDLIVVGQCFMTQSPYILKYFSNNDNFVFILNENKREYYEKTSHDYFSPKKIISRLIRYPIKIIDKHNCSFATKIISNSYYSKSMIKNIYKKNSHVIYPGLKPIIPRKIVNNITNNFLSIGTISEFKGHSACIKILKNLKVNLRILGRILDRNEFNYIMSLTSPSKAKINIIVNPSNLVKNKYLNNNSTYLVCQSKEPFGISTLEATSSGMFIIGNNSGGTSEIVKNGINGYLFQNNIFSAIKIVKHILRKKNISYYITTKIDWKFTTKQIIDYIQ